MRRMAQREKGKGANNGRRECRAEQLRVDVCVASPEFISIFPEGCEGTVYSLSSLF